MLSTATLLVVTATVGIFHMSAPDHWVTLVILGRISGWNRKTLFLVSIMTAVGHVLLSILLGVGVVILGLAFSSTVSVYVTEGTGLIMIVVGLGYAVFELRAPGTADYEEVAKKQAVMVGGAVGKRVRYFTVLGAALSPDLSILPIFLVAVPVGLGLAFEVSAIFAISSILALSILVLAGSAGLSKAFAKVPPKYNGALVGLTIAAVGAYILIAG